ncbi:zinc finger BED domain-containing protein RICESLEEPER 2-like [Tasmannia lanceolata]|uniref:zinc finger BED domain-containing protein RICESLEEPER 2-like n=1 Tax=Tasmannia lanceolata TaxID=3420 RepID=UPI004064BA25
MSQEEAPNVISSEQSSNPTDSNQTVGTGGTTRKRKSMRSRSDVWDHFTKFVNEVGEHKASCMYCEREFCCDPKRNETSSLKNHVTACKKFPGNMNTTQTQLNYQPTKGQEGNGSGTLSIWKFDQEAIRNALARMIITDELPFKSVEKEGFRHLMSVACPRFHIPSRSTVARDCYQFFLEERSKLKNHKGEALGKAIEKCLLDWGIDRVFTVTVDNASSNDVVVGYLRRRLINWVDRVRTAVRYVRSSLSRLKLFKKCVENERIQSKSLLCLDVSTRWNSTYLMLKAAEKIEKAFDMFDVEDPFFSSELDSVDVDGIRKPDHEDWEKVRKMATLLHNFYELTIRVS